MSRQRIPLNKLIAIAGHISYEVEMFEYSGDRLMKGGLNIGEKNVMLETFVIHARCLYDFLYPSKKSRNDDAKADDFFEDVNELRSKLPSKLSISSYLSSRTGKEIAHLTYGRIKVTPEQKPWQIDEIHNQIGEALVIFFETLTQERRSWFPKVLTR